MERIDLDYSEEYLVVDAIVDDAVYFRTVIPDGGYFVLDPKHSGVVAKGAHGHVRFDFLRHPAVMRVSSETEEDFAEAARDLIIARGYDPKKFRLIRPHALHILCWYAEQMAPGTAARRRRRGTSDPALVGSGSEHGNEANLSFKLHLVLSGKASDTVLDTYDAERQPPSMHTIKASVETGKLMQTNNPFRIAMRSFTFFLDRHSRFINRQFFKAWQRKPPYQDGLMGKTHTWHSMHPHL